MKKNDESILNTIASVLGFYIICSLFFGGINEIPVFQDWKNERNRKEQIISEARNQDYQNSIKGKFKLEPLFFASYMIRSYDSVTKWPKPFGPSFIALWTNEKNYVYESLDSCENYKNKYSYFLSIVSKDVNLNCSIIN